MKILFVTAEPHPTFRADVRVLFGKYLPRHGVASDLFTQAAADGEAVSWPAGRTLLAPATRSKWRKQWLMFMHDLSLFRLARQGYDAVQVRDRVLAGAIGLLAARRARIPFYYWASYPKPESRSIVATAVGPRRAPLRWLVNMVRGRLAERMLYRFVLPRADHVFVQSEAMKAAFVRHGLLSGHMTAVPMGVDVEALAKVAAAPSALVERLNARRVIVYAGALDRVRKPGLMLEAMSLVVREEPKAYLLMVGGSPDPRDEADLRAQAEALGLGSNVEFTGWLPTAEAQALMSLGEIGLSLIPRGPLYDVSSPTKLAEYFALGLAVVANDLPDQAQVLAESGAGACVSWNASEVAREILRLLHDEAARAAQATAGRAHVLQHRSYEALSAVVAATYMSEPVPQGPPV